MMSSNLLASSPLIGMITWQSFLAASSMMAMVGLVAFTVMRRVPVQSWRLRSWLVAAVLLQGMMLVRSPVHLGLIELQSPTSVQMTAPVIDVGLLETVTETQRDVAKAQSDVSSTLLSQSPVQTGLWHQVDRVIWSTVLIRVWLAVTLAMLVIAANRYVQVLRLVRQLKPAPEQWQQQWKPLLKKRRLFCAGSKCEMLVSQSAGPLMVRRATRYSLVVPESYWLGLSDQQRRGVMLHELAHLERHDVWRQLIARVITTIHWFNPIAWWALRQYEQAAECACDQRVANDGKHSAAGFASALVELVQWNNESRTSFDLRRGIGFQAMAAPPLSVRVSLLLKPKSTGDSPMKRLSLGVLALALIAVSFFQIRLTTAQESDPDGLARLQVISKDVAGRLSEIAAQLDRSDPTTERFGSLFESTSGKIAVAGYLNALGGRSRDDARAEAIPRFIEKHFAQDNGKLVVRPESKEASARWTRQSQRLAVSIDEMKTATNEIAAKMDTSTEAGGLFKRLLEDPQAPVAVLMNEMKGGDVISRYLSEKLDQLLVDQGNGTFRIVESRRREAEEQVEKFERADKFGKRLRRELPNLAAEYSKADKKHERLIEYLQNPLTATIVAMELAGDAGSVSDAVEKLHQHFEDVSIDTPAGLKIAKEEAWEKMDEIFGRVDRASSILPRIEERLSEISETLSVDDPLTTRLAAQMKQGPLPVLLAAELPYAEANAGEELRALLSEVISESGGKMSINSDREEEVAEKARELLQVCRKIRRYVGDVDDMLDDVADRVFVATLGDAGRYTMLDEIRRFAERHRPDPVALMQADLLVQTEGNKLRVREDRSEIVRRLVEQSEQVRAEAANDDF